MFKGLNRERTISPSFSFLAVTSFCLMCGLQSPAVGQKKIDLVAIPPSTTGQNVKIRVQVKGDLVVVENDQFSTTPMQVDGSFDYQEKTLRSAKSIRAVRRYDEAVADINIGKSKSKSELTEVNRWVVVDRRPESEGEERVRFLTSGSGLSQKEFELLALPANSMFFDRCIEKKDLAIGDTWTPDSDLLADLLFVDEITKNEFQFRLKKATRSKAVVSLTGNLTAKVDDSKTQLRVMGQFEFDLKGGFTSGVRLTIGEQREVGQIAPGYEVTTTMEMRVDRRKNRDSITDATLAQAGITKRKWSDSMSVTSRSERFALRHQRDWRVIKNETDATILRCLHQGYVMAQCTAIALPKSASASAYPLTRFTKDVEENVAGNARVSDSKEWSTKRGHLVYRVDVVGREDGVDITWLYYHVSQPDGQRVSLVVSYDDSIAETFAGRETMLVESVSFPKPMGKSVSIPDSKTSRR